MHFITGCEPIGRSCLYSNFIFIAKQNKTILPQFRAVLHIFYLPVRIKKSLNVHAPSNGAGKVSHCQNIAEKIPRKNRQMSAFPGDKIS